MSYPIKSPRKLIEVALPLDAINLASAREKSIRHGHPSTLHLWWARRPLAAARAVIFAQLVNDPGYQQGGGFKYGRNKTEAAIERQRLFRIIEDLVEWESTTKETVLEAARAEIRRSWREVCALNKDHPQAREMFDPTVLPPFHDPFAGGGGIPLEAQRLGLNVYASDLNPVAVLINKATIEIPQRFAGLGPVGIVSRRKDKPAELSLPKQWPGTTGLTEDIRRYGGWMRTEAQARLCSLYPPVEVTSEIAAGRPDLEGRIGAKLTVIAWLWARTVKSPNPAFSHVDVPLASTFVLATKPGKEAYLEPVIEGNRYRFVVRLGPPPLAAKNGTKIARGAKFRCLVSGTAIEPGYIKAEGMAGRIGAKLLAVVAEGERGRIYLSPTREVEAVAERSAPAWRPEGSLRDDGRAFTPTLYGLKKWSDLFTNRQLLGLTVLTDLVHETRTRVKHDALAAGLSDDGNSLAAGGSGADAYSDAVGTYLGIFLSRLINLNNAMCQWRNDPAKEHVGHLFARQAIPMVWDFAEANPLSNSGGSFDKTFDFVPKVLEFLPTEPIGVVQQADAAAQRISSGKIVSTDPPYYDNIDYADLSDFFYVWLRRALRPQFPSLFATLTTPKTDELVAKADLHGGKQNAEAFFLKGMTSAMHCLAEQAHPAAPITIYYAFKQSETESNGENETVSTGWDTFLEAVIRAGLVITGTWPMRTELANRMRGSESNALASSIVLVCRKRSGEAAVVSRREFLRELNEALPESLDEMTKGAGGGHSPVAPVDLSQAIIGPGMAVYSKYAAVLEADGSPMSVRTALQLINRFLAEDDFDAESQFCLHWFEQYNWSDGAFGVADTLSRGKGTNVDRMKEAGVLQSGAGKVRLLKWAEYPADWDPRTDKRTPVWEALHQLIRALKQGGETASGELLAALGGKAEAVRQLAYRLYTLCERLGQAEDARAYNELITSWSGIESAANSVPQPVAPQGLLFEDEGASF